MADPSRSTPFPLDLAGRRARVGEECGEAFESDEDYEGLTVTVELRSHAEGRAVIGWLDTLGAVTVPERFARVMAEFRKMVPQSRMIGEVRMPNGDRGHCFFFTDYEGDVCLEGIDEVARAKAGWRQGETNAAQMARFCDMLDADFQRRQSDAAAKESAP